MHTDAPQQSMQSVVHQPRSISEPATPKSARFQSSPTIAQLQLQLPETIELDNLRSAFHEQKASKVETEQNIARDYSPEEVVLSKQSICELKEYELLFDRNRRQKQAVFLGLPGDIMASGLDDGSSKEATKESM